MNAPVALSRHDNVKFHDQTVFLTGNAYLGCEFHRCVIILKGLPFHFQNCKFIGCIWHFDFVLHDRDQLASLQKFIAEVVQPSLPAMPKSNDPLLPPSLQGPIDVR